jgi:hypothetical protein
MQRRLILEIILWLLRLSQITRHLRTTFCAYNYLLYLQSILGDNYEATIKNNAAAKALCPQRNNAAVIAEIALQSGTLPKPGATDKPRQTL